MRIDLPGCNLKTCRYCQDHNCIDKNRYDGCNYARLNNLEVQGLLLELPCKVGDTIYVIPSKVNYDLNVVNRRKKNNRVYEQKVHSIEMFSNDRYLLTTCDGLRSVLADSYKEIWFLTYEEAEQALKQMGE